MLQAAAASGERPFFLSCREVQTRFKLKSNSTGAVWLRGLVDDGVIEVVKRGTADDGKASTYRYVTAN